MSENVPVPSPVRNPMDVGLGSRVRDQRIERLLSQAQLAAGAGISGSYLSLIESGRRPAGSAVLERLATVLGCSVEFLRTGRGGPGSSAMELDLRFAEVALRAGEFASAHERFSDVYATAHEKSLFEVELEARWGLARATEAMGSVESAIEDYEAIAHAEPFPRSLDRTAVLTALCRAYRECGDLARAIELGEAALASRERDDPAARPIDDSTIALASTLVGCFFERGDLTRAQSLARTTLARAQKNGSPVARAAALWNAGLVSEARGDLRTARTYVERALALYSETDNARATSLLRVASAWLTLRERRPDVSAAEALLRRALDDLPTVGTSLDLAYGETELARCHLLRGDWQTAIVLAEAVTQRLAEDGPRIEAARARLVVGDAHLVGGNTEAATKSYSQAAEALRSSGAQRQAASAWRELAENLARLGREAEALNAYRSASDAAGIASPPYELDRIKRSTREARTEKVGAAAASDRRQPKRLRQPPELGRT